MKKSKYKWIYVVAFILLSLLAIFLIFGAERTLKFEALDPHSADAVWLLSKPIAHRGYHDNDQIPENSLASFSEAVKKGYAIELDVLLTKDDQVVVVHDNNLKRLTGYDINVNNVTLNELKQYTLLGTEHSIPTLSETLELVEGKVPILLEIKSSGFSHKLDEYTYSIIKDYAGSIAIQSFNASSIRWFSKNAPQFPRGNLLRGNLGFDMANRFLDNMYMIYSNPNFVAYKYENLVKTDFSVARKNGLIVLCWTVDESMLSTREFSEHADNIILEGQK